MGMAYIGLTHCYDCGHPLGDAEFCRCNLCQIKYDKKQKEIEFNLAVEKRVKIELAKMNKDIKTITLRDIDENEKQYSGYWERRYI